MTKSHNNLSHNNSSHNQEIIAVMSKLLNCPKSEIANAINLFNKIDAVKLNCLDSIAELKRDDIITAHMELRYLSHKFKDKERAIRKKLEQ